MAKKTPSEEQFPCDSEIQEKLLELLRRLSDQRSQDEKRRRALFLVPEAIVIQTMQKVVGPEIRTLNHAIEFLQWDFLHPQPLRVSGDSHERIVAFPTAVPALGSVWFQLFWNHEQQARALPENQRAFLLHAVDLLRQVVCQEASRWPNIIPEHEARALLLPAGPYHTSLGMVTVGWNNAMVREICPFCSALFKPSWGLWPFLESETGGPICSDCWSQGEEVMPIPEVRI